MHKALHGFRLLPDSRKSRKVICHLMQEGLGEPGSMSSHNCLCNAFDWRDRDSSKTPRDHFETTNSTCQPKVGAGFDYTSTFMRVVHL
jgi:hypothetical protein